MLIRISLIIAILAGLAAGGLNFVKVKEKITTLQTNLQTQTTRADTAERSLASTKKELDKTTADLKQTQDTLTATAAERDTAVKVAAEKEKAAAKLATDLANTQKDLSETRGQLEEYKAPGLTAAQVASLAKDLKSIQDALAAVEGENKVISRKNDELQFELDKYRGNIKIVFLPSNLKGSVVVSDPKWDFVILNVGEDQGVKKDGELLVSHQGHLVGKVIVRTVDKNRCIANVMPGWKLGEIMEGDDIIPANPASS